MNKCKHFVGLGPVTPKTPKGCEECLEMGDEWFHLRLCLVCGHVGCCDQSKNKHARKHWEKLGHSVIRSFEPAETWEYCFIDDLTVD